MRDREDCGTGTAQAGERDERAEVDHPHDQEIEARPQRGEGGSPEADAPRFTPDKWFCEEFGVEVFVWIAQGDDLDGSTTLTRVRGDSFAEGAVMARDPTVLGEAGQPHNDTAHHCVVGGWMAARDACAWKPAHS